MFPFKLNFCQLKINPYKTHSQADMKTSCHWLQGRHGQTFHPGYPKNLTKF